MHIFSFLTVISKFLFFVFQSIFETHNLSFYSVVMLIYNFFNFLFLKFLFLISSLILEHRTLHFLNFEINAHLFRIFDF